MIESQELSASLRGGDMELILRGMGGNRIRETEKQLASRNFHTELGRVNFQIEGLRLPICCHCKIIRLLEALYLNIQPD